MSQLTTIQNPFRSAIVADPWHWDVVDVPEIHDAAFTLCRRALEHVRQHRQSTSVLLHGDAGSGKTHLLARLQAWLGGELTIYGAAPPAIFISVRMQTSPQMIWRHLLARFGEDLLRETANGRSQLERILLPRLAEVCPAIGEPRSWLDRVQREWRRSPAVVEEVEDALDRLDQVAGLNDRDLAIVLGYFLLGRHRRDVRAWLRGESLPEAALEQLGLKSEVEGDPEERARTLVLSLCRMTGPAMPIIFCFDQVEALQAHPNDLAGLHRFGQLVSLLRDETQNTLLISCILSVFIDSLNRAVISSDYDRMKAFGHLPLRALDPGEAKRLIEARLTASPELRRLRRTQRDRFWPLTEGVIDQALARNINTPRALLSYCADRFELDWRPELHRNPPTTAEFLTREMEERLEIAAATVKPAETGTILAHGLPLLLQMVDARWERGATAPLKGLELVLESSAGRLAISLCNHNNMTSLATHLRRLRDQMRERILEETGGERYLLLRDLRLPLSSLARRTREYREELLALGFHWIGVTGEMVAAVDALRRLLSEAKAGDLANGGEAIPEAAVQDWVRTNLTTRLRPLCDLLTALLPDGAPLGVTSPATDFDLGEDLGELLALHHVLAVEYVAMRLEQEPETIEACARNHPERFGLLTGPPALLFQPLWQPIDFDGLAFNEVDLNGQAGTLTEDGVTWPTREEIG